MGGLSATKGAPNAGGDGADQPLLSASGSSFPLLLSFIRLLTASDPSGSLEAKASAPLLSLGALINFSLLLRNTKPLGTTLEPLIREVLRNWHRTA